MNLLNFIAACPYEECHCKQIQEKDMVGEKHQKFDAMWRYWKTNQTHDERKRHIYSDIPDKLVQNHHNKVLLHTQQKILKKIF